MRPGQDLPSRIDQVLRDLPGPYAVARLDEARLVVGPTGACVMVPAPNRAPAILDAVQRVNNLAATTRRALCDHVTWVPFIDTLLVGSRKFVRRPDVTVAPVDLLAVALTEGPMVIWPPCLDAIRLALRTGELEDWRVAPDGHARIDLCDPVRPAHATSSIRR